MGQCFSRVGSRGAEPSTVQTAYRHVNQTSLNKLRSYIGFGAEALPVRPGEPAEVRVWVDEIAGLRRVKVGFYEVTARGTPPASHFVAAASS